MSRATTTLERLVWAGLAGAGLGLSVLLVYAWVEYLNNPGISLVDGYWIGRVPWTPLGVGLVLTGTSLALLSAVALVVVRGDLVRWLLILVVLAMPVLWWLGAIGVLPIPRYSAPDPITLAYSLPESAAIALIAPAIAAAVVAFVPSRPDMRVRLRPIPRDPSRDDPDA